MTALKNRALLLLIVGQSFSLLADWALRAALLIWVYAMTHSAVAVSLVGLCEAVPIMLVAPLAGACVDRWHRAHTMVAALVARVVVLLPLLAIHGQEGLPLLLVVTCLANGVSQFFVTAGAAAVPMLVTAEELGPANSLLQMAMSIVTIAAPVLGATVYAAFGPQAMVLVIIALYLLGLPCLILVPAGKPERAATSVRPSLAAEVADGLRYLAVSRMLVALTVGLLILWLGAGGLGVMDVIFVTHALHLSTATAGVLMASYGAGNVAGAALAWLTSRHVGRYAHVVLWVTNVAIGGALVTYASTPTLVLAAGALFLVGLPVPALVVSWNTLAQLCTSDAFLGRVMSIVNMSSSVSKIISLSCVGILATAFGVRPTIAIFGTFLLLTGVWFVVTVRTTPQRRAGTAAPEEEHEAALEIRMA